MAELDKEYEAYRLAQTRRLGLKDIHIAQGYMRGADPSWPAVRPEDVPHTAGMLRIVLAQEGATLTGAVDPQGIDEMLAEWEHQIADKKPDDPRKFTRRVISEHLALNQHRDENAGELLICGALWLIMTKPDMDAEGQAMVRRGDVEIRYDIKVEDDQRRMRFRFSMAELHPL